MDICQRFFGSFLILFACGCAALPKSEKAEWETIFDGQSLQGWTPKLAEENTGTDFLNTFRAENGRIIVSYSDYNEFDNKFGNLFFDRKLSDFRLKLEYRFIGEQAEGGADWAFANSGLMLLSQSPETMSFEQGFPVSVEAQFLALSDAYPKRTTANICTPGTHIVVENILTEQHCINSTTPAAPIGEWVEFEVDVRRNGDVTLYVNNEVAFEFSEPQLDLTDESAVELYRPGRDLREGYIALQSESHPIEFRNIQLLDRSLGGR